MTKQLHDHGFRSVILPLPPSLNAAYFNRKPGTKGKGRVPTRVYAAWLIEAGLIINIAKMPAVSGAYELKIAVCHTMRGDIDNRCKAIIDLLVKQKITDDDRFLWAMSICRSADIDPGRCEIRLQEVNHCEKYIW